MSTITLDFTELLAGIEKRMAGAESTLDQAMKSAMAEVVRDLMARMTPGSTRAVGVDTGFLRGSMRWRHDGGPWKTTTVAVYDIPPGCICERERVARHGAGVWTCPVHGEVIEAVARPVVAGLLGDGEG